MNLWGLLLKLWGWKVRIRAPRRQKCVICVAPHTSNLYFLIGLASYSSMGRKANFLMKKFWFFFPLGLLLRAFGGVPVDRKHAGGLVDQMVERFKTVSYMNLAVTPEGTRKANPQWHTGFLRIAYGAGVPVQLGVIDYRRRLVIIDEEYPLTGNIESDLAGIKAYYSGYADAARKPEKFKV